MNFKNSECAGGSAARIIMLSGLTNKAITVLYSKGTYAGLGPLGLLRSPTLQIPCYRVIGR